MTIDIRQIKGWGADADPENDPVYPMRDMSKDDSLGMNWPRPPQQPASVEVLHSNERPNLTAVFGTSTPPRGLSGMIRRQAFKRSEGQWSHWLLLLMADRINVVEGLFQDIARGRMPRIFREMGIRAEAKHNPQGLVRKVLIGLTVLLVIALLIFVVILE